VAACQSLIHTFVTRFQIVFLGNGRSGKTSLLGTLAKRNLDPDQKSTRGVEMDPYGLDQKSSMLSKRKMGFPDMELSWWDFAGQLEYSAAHQFFLSARQALYVIVFSMQEDNESIMQQLFYWLSVIPEPQAHVVRIVVVGTKIDLIPPMHLKDQLRIKRSVVQQVIETKGLANKVTLQDVVFVTASNTFVSMTPTELEKDWETCRRALKTRLYHHIADIFQQKADLRNCTDPLERQRREEELDKMRYPKDCKAMSTCVKELCKFLQENRQLPCLKLDNEHAIRLLGGLWRGKDLEHCKNYYKTAMGMRALEVCHDLGIVSLYGRHNPIPSVCVEPSFTTKIISLLVDPQTDFPAITTVEHLEDILIKYPDVSRIHKDSKKEDKDRQKHELVELLVSLGLVRRYEGSPKILVPLALRGRPDCWSKILKTSRESAFLLGLRLGVNPAVSVPAAAFIQLMLEKCEDAERMWGCAFAYDVRGYGNGSASSVLFVRLSEDRRSVDIVAVMDSDMDSFHVVQAEMESIATLLGEGFNDQRDRMPLCPMCCCTDFFVRSGNVHAFHRQELTVGGALICTRHHNVTSVDCLRGKFTMLELDALPFVYPTKMHTLQLPWKCVSQGGIIGNFGFEDEQDITALEALSTSLSVASSNVESSTNVDESKNRLSIPSITRPVSSTGLDVLYEEGTFTDVSFFVLSGQVSVGDIISAQDRLIFALHMRLCISEDCSCSITLTSGVRKTLRFSFKVGETIPNSYVQGLLIQGIFPSDIGDKALDSEASKLQRFCAHDNVLVIFGPIRPKTKYLVFPGTNASKLNLVRITPALCKTDSIAAVCWAEMQVCFCLSCCFHL
jgi:GTPase SAR1 family protein